jgi:hypothetical protein
MNFPDVSGLFNALLARWGEREAEERPRRGKAFEMWQAGKESDLESAAMERELAKLDYTRRRQAELAAGKAARDERTRREMDRRKAEYQLYSMPGKPDFGYVRAHEKPTRMSEKRGIERETLLERTAGY